MLQSLWYRLFFSWNIWWPWLTSFHHLLWRPMMKVQEYHWEFPDYQGRSPPKTRDHGAEAMEILTLSLSGNAALRDTMNLHGRFKEAPSYSDMITSDPDIQTCQNGTSFILIKTQVTLSYSALEIHWQYLTHVYLSKLTAWWPLPFQP
jgi:hypothetical protein